MQLAGKGLALLPWGLIGRRPESCPDILDGVTECYLDGTFFLRQMGLFYPETPHVNIKQLQDRLMPLLERFNVMFLRNLRALRELKIHPININIGQAGQVNVGQQQVNVGSAASRD